MNINSKSLSTSGYVKHQEINQGCLVSEKKYTKNDQITPGNKNDTVGKNDCQIAFIMTNHS